MINEPNLGSALFELIGGGGWSIAGEDIRYTDEALRRPEMAEVSAKLSDMLLQYEAEKVKKPIMDEILSLESQCARSTIKLSSLLSAPSPDLVAINSEREFLNEKLATIEALRATLNIN